MRSDKTQVLDSLARPERFELPTFWFVARRSIQLSYGRVMLGCLPNDDDFRKSLNYQDLFSSVQTPERGDQVAGRPRGAHPAILLAGFEESPAREGRSRAEAVIAASG